MNKNYFYRLIVVSVDFEGLNHLTIVCCQRHFYMVLQINLNYYYFICYNLTLCIAKIYKWKTTLYSHLSALYLSFNEINNLFFFCIHRYVVWGKTWFLLKNVIYIFLWCIYIKCYYISVEFCSIFWIN